MIKFKITDDPDQQFGAILNNQRVTIRLRYNVLTDRWSLDLSIDDVPVLHGRRLVNGVDILRAFNFGIGAIFSGGPAEPGRDNLPSDIVSLYHATEADLLEAA